jgi:ribosome maturation factor RimP
MTPQEKKIIIENQVVTLLQEEPSLFLVQVKIDAKNNIKVFLDGDAGISIGQCTTINRALYPFIEEGGYFPNDDFSLEVSSAGIDEPLTLQRQYIKNIGRDIAITKLDGTTCAGKIVAANDVIVELEITEGKGKKAVISQLALEYVQIKTAVIQIKF